MERRLSDVKTEAARANSKTVLSWEERGSTCESVLEDGIEVVHEDSNEVQHTWCFGNCGGNAWQLRALQMMGPGEARL